MDMKYLRIGQHVQTEGEERVMTMKFPNPTWPPSINDVNSPVISLDNLIQHQQQPRASRQYVAAPFDLECQLG
jgi:hypothetical protein